MITKRKKNRGFLNPGERQLEGKERRGWKKNPCPSVVEVTEIRRGVAW